MSKLEYYKFANQLCKNLGKTPSGKLLTKAIKYKFSDLDEAEKVGDMLSQEGTPLELVVVQKDVITQAVKDVESELNPLIVNPTHDQACGDWDTGAAGFEESLAYRSTLSMSLTDDAHYTIRKDECVYSPCVQVFRGGDYTPIKSFPVSIVSLVPMPRADFSVDNDRMRMRSSIRAVFLCAMKHGHTSVIFNAFGIKDDNNPIDMAQLFGEILTEYARAVRRVTFVFDNEVNSPNFMAFRKYMKYVPPVAPMETPD